MMLIHETQIISVCNIHSIIIYRRSRPIDDWFPFNEFYAFNMMTWSSVYKVSSMLNQYSCKSALSQNVIVRISYIWYLHLLIGIWREVCIYVCGHVRVCVWKWKCMSRRENWYLIAHYSTHHIYTYFPLPVRSPMARDYRILSLQLFFLHL